MSLQLTSSAKVVYQTTPGGAFASLIGKLGSVEATIHCKFSSLNPFRVCFATCTGQAHELQGKVRDFPTIDAVEHELASIQNDLSQGTLH